MWRFYRRVPVDRHPLLQQRVTYASSAGDFTDIGVNRGGSARYRYGVGVDHSSVLRRIAAGDQRALEELYAEFNVTVLRFVQRRVGDPGLAEEIAADVWLGCWRSAAAFRGDSQVLTWLLGIAVRQIYSRLRGKRLTLVPLESNVDILDDRVDPAEEAISNMTVEGLVARLRHLPPELYDTVVLAWLHELPYEEIAGVTRVPIGTVKSRISRARRLVRNSIGDDRE
jgi:RNA polymerase sigma factor (sigma-70 family)